MKTLTVVHVAISLIGIVSGLVMLFGLLTANRLERWTALFLITTVATSVTGFLFPFHGFTPGIGLGIISLVLLAIAIVARYPRHLAGAWRWIFVITAMVSFYFNVFVLIAQLFQKVAALRELAPTQSDPAFLATQLATLLLFLVLTILAVIRFRIPSSAPQSL
jgi:hypothetical protein